MNYFNNKSNRLRNYYILLSDIPNFIYEFVNTKAMQRIDMISYDNGADYTDLFMDHPWYSNLDHSIAVALITWHFTHDMKQTLASLFHDIATPVFKHAIDCMNGDSLTQESTEEKTREIIENDKDIMELLKKYNISLDEVCDYHMYPICDNDLPRLSSDRFEYNFSCGYMMYPVWSFSDLKECFLDVSILRDENGVKEMGFNNYQTAIKYIKNVSKLWPLWMNKEKRIVLQFLADICLSCENLGLLTVDDLYTLSEEEVINIFKNSGYKEISEAFYNFQKSKMVLDGDAAYSALENNPNLYHTDMSAKVRYVDPLVNIGSKNLRISKVSTEVASIIDEFKQEPNGGLVVADFEFTPIKKILK